MNAKKIWNADIYLRLSKEDEDKEIGNKRDSDIITNQRELALAFIKDRADICLHEIRVDDGYTGSNFDRPAFVKMMDDVRAGVVDCIIVKDLSRFGREYITIGEYLDKIFPVLGVRFIAINDGYDTSNKRTASEDLIIPFKNLINDSYCRDTSLKVRALFEMKRRQGEFIGSFAVYGYRKDPENKNKLIIDEPAAQVVQEIFRMKLSGMSQNNIADYLNEMGILCPTEYKKAQGMKFFCSFASNKFGQWHGPSVTYILKNEIYLGVLIQGVTETPTYKVKERITKPREEWSIIRNAHPPIINESDFAAVQRSLSLETRTAPKAKTVYLFSGLISCGVCGEQIVRKVVPSGKKKFSYYICNGKKKGKGCASHSISTAKVDAAILEVLKQHLLALGELKQIVASLDQEDILSVRIQSLQSRLAQKQDEIATCRNFKRSLYENYVKGILEREDFDSYNADYDAKIQTAEQQCQSLRNEIEKHMDGKHDKLQWLRELNYQTDVECFTREVVLYFIDAVKIMENGELEIAFRFADAYADTLALVEKAKKNSPREVV